MIKQNKNGTNSYIESVITQKELIRLINRQMIPFFGKAQRKMFLSTLKKEMGLEVRPKKRATQQDTIFFKACLNLEFLTKPSPNYRKTQTKMILNRQKRYPEKDTAL